jgi:hypothetical protein
LPKEKENDFSTHMAEAARKSKAGLPPTNNNAKKNEVI